MTSYSKLHWELPLTVSFNSIPAVWQPDRLGGGLTSPLAQRPAPANLSPSTLTCLPCHNDCVRDKSTHGTPCTIAIQYRSRQSINGASLGQNRNLLSCVREDDKLSILTRVVYDLET